MNEDYEWMKRLMDERRSRELQIIRIKSAHSQNDTWSFFHPDRIKSRIKELQSQLQQAGFA